MSRRFEVTRQVEGAVGSLALALVLAVTTARPGATARADERKAAAAVELAGRWMLNAELSDDAREKMQQAGRDRPGGPGGRGPGGGGMGGPGGGGMGGPGGGSGGPPGGGRGAPGGRGLPPGAGGGDDPREAMRAVLEPAEELTVAQSAVEISVDERYGRMRRLHPDGKTYKTDNGASELKSYWKDGKLVVETKRERGSVVETWERIPDGSRLIVTLRLDGGPGGRLELKRIYDRAEDVSPPPR
jgi:hypothetical protein